MSQQKQEQQQQLSAIGNNALGTDEELYERKTEELQVHLPRLERLVEKASVTEESKIKSFIDIIMRNKRVTMDVLLSCERSLKNSQMIYEKHAEKQQRRLLEEQKQFNEELLQKLVHLQLQKQNGELQQYYV
jgi:hypothetical protein